MSSIGKFLHIFPEYVLKMIKVKGMILWGQLPKIDESGNSGPYGGKRPHRELCKPMKKTSTFKKWHSEEIYHIHRLLNWNCKNKAYLIECNQYWKHYTSSSKIKFRYMANNYKSTHGKFKSKKVPKNL